METNQNTNWIWLPVWTPEDDDFARIVYFRKEFNIEEGRLPETYRLRISADSRYKLYINGQFVQEGPQKATDLKEWFADYADIAPYLREGCNAAAVEVLRYPAPSPSSMHPKSNDSLYRTEMPGLYVEDLNNEAGANLSAGTGWRCRINRGIRIIGEDELPAPIHAQEDVTAASEYAGWKYSGYDDSSWENASERMLSDISLGDAPFNLVDRNVPLMHCEEKNFESVSAVRHADAEEGVLSESIRNKISDAYKDMLSGKSSITIPAHNSQIVEISAGAEECGYLIYSLAGGRNARIITLCSECYVYPQLRGVPVKGDRADSVNGQLTGHRSFYKAAGYGSEDSPEIYEPFWFRTFRYIRLEIETADEPLTILGFRYRATGYPLEIQTECTASDPDFAGIWDISERTLRRCMHDTYMDCPFYEQLQYAMDTRSEALYTYAVSGDDRLARQAMEAFRRSQRPDGMINCDAPTVKCNVIPGFSIYYLLMVYDHMMYFGDRDLVKLHLPAIDQILAFFDRNLNENGIVSKIGGPLFHEKYWSFADWTPEWNDTVGAPAATDKGRGASTMESLQYLYGLQKAAELADFAGRKGLAEEYLGRADRLMAAIRSSCIGKFTESDVQGLPMIQDGPGIDDYSVHCQVFGILTGLLSPEEGRIILDALIGRKGIAQASVSFSFYLFRALEMCGMYERTDKLWNIWRDMLRDNLTTCVENNTDARSDCHAWGSLILYELPSVILGVRPAAPGYEKISVAPVPGYLEHAEGTVFTPHGDIHVAWRRDESTPQDIDLKIECSDAVKARIQ